MKVFCVDASCSGCSVRSGDDRWSPVGRADSADPYVGRAGGVDSNADSNAVATGGLW